MCVMHPADVYTWWRTPSSLRHINKCCKILVNPKPLYLERSRTVMVSAPTSTARPTAVVRCVFRCRVRCFFARQGQGFSGPQGYRLSRHFAAGDGEVVLNALTVSERKQEREEEAPS